MKNSLTLAMLLSLLAAGCSDSDSNDPSSLPAADTTQDVVVVGPVTGFGSVIVAGVHFNTDSTIVTMDDEPGTPHDLRLGMVVAVMGTINSETGAAAAGEIDFVDNAEGPISSIDHAAGTFVVLGQTVFVDELTIFENVAFENLAAGNVVQVSGMWRNQALAQVQATHVYLVANQFQDGMTMEVKGLVDELDIGNQRFRIGTQTCNYSAATMELDGYDLANGLYVQASSAGPIDEGHMMLNRVQAREHDRNRYQLCTIDCAFELVGYITLIVSDNEFEVDGHLVRTDGDTVYVNGTADSVALDVRVSVAGTLDDNGVLVAELVVFHLPSLVEIKANVEAVNVENDYVTALGIDVYTNEFTLFRDHTTAGPPGFGLDSLAPEDRIEIRAVLDAGTVIATRLERDYADDVATLKALVEEIEKPSIRMLGVTVTSDENTVFQNAAHVEIDADEFFDLVEIDDIVRVEGTYDVSSVTITASKMFLRECLNNCL